MSDIRLPASETIWLSMRGGTALTLRLLVCLVAVVVLTTCVLVGIVNTAGFPTPERARRIALLFLYLSPLFGLLWLVTYLRGLAWIQIALGSDGHRFVLRKGDGAVIESASIDTVRTDGQYLLIGRRLAPLYHVRKAAYDLKALNTHFIAKLPLGARVPMWRLFLHAIRAGNRGLIGLTLLALAIIVWKAVLFPGHSP